MTQQLVKVWNLKSEARGIRLDYTLPQMDLSAHTFVFWYAYIEVEYSNYWVVGLISLWFTGLMVGLHQIWFLVKGKKKPIYYF